MRDDTAELLFNLFYGIPATLTFLWVWILPALDMFQQGEMLACVVWLGAPGPLVASIAGAGWPIYWLWFY